VFGRLSSTHASCDTNIVVANVEVEVGVDLALLSWSRRLVMSGNWVPILPCDL